LWTWWLLEVQNFHGAPFWSLAPNPNPNATRLGWICDRN
jgi:hypothetical protein